MKRLFITTVVLALLFVGEVAADMPQLISYQGVLTDGSGSAVSDGIYSITFRLYTAPAGGSSIWEETNPNVQVTKGIFNATLGTTVGLSSLPFDATYYVGISVAGGAELSPRQQLTAVPYSFNAKAVMGTANEFPSSGSVGVGTISPGYPLHIQSSDIRPVRIDGTAEGSWAFLSLNASGAASNPAIEFLRTGSARAELYVNSVNDLKLRQAGAITLTSEDVTGNLGIGIESPLEKLHVGGGVLIGTTANLNAGTLRWTGSDFEGYDGSTWKSFTATSGGSLPPGSSGNTLRHNGSDWVATNSPYNDGTNIGLGTLTPSAKLHLYGSDSQVERIETSSGTTTAQLELKTTDGANDFLRLMKYGSSASATVDGIPLADVGFIYTGTMGGPMIFDVMTSNPMYFLTNNTTRMLLDSSGNLGINTKFPGAKLHVDGNQWDLTNTEGDFKIGDSAYRLKFGVATGGGGAGTAGLRVVGGAQKLILGGGTAEVLSVDGAGYTTIGGATSNAKLHLYRSGVDSAVVKLYSSSTGGIVRLTDEADNDHIRLEPDGNGTGGYLLITRNTGSAGFAVDGNYAGTENTAVTIAGDYGTTFNTANAGNASVTLPASAIGKAEILDEPGAASYAEGSAATLLDAGGAVTVIGSQSIGVPGAGYVLVLATAQLMANHTSGNTMGGQFGVSASSAAFPANQDVAFILASAMPTYSSYNFPINVHGLFEVSAAGSNTFYFLGQQSGMGPMTMYDVQLTCVYIPTAYGTVQPTLAGANAKDEDASTRPVIDVAAQRAVSEAANNERIMRELEALRAEIEALKEASQNR